MRVFSTSWKYIRRSPYQAISAILTMYLTILMGGFFLSGSVASALVLNYFERKPQIVVFLKDKTDKNEADSLSNTIRSTGKVSDIKYISKDEALSIYKEQYKEDPLLVEMVTADILPSSLEISANDPKYLLELEEIINKSGAVENVIYQKDVVDALLMWTNAIRITGMVLAGLLAIDSFLVIIMVIGMKIALRKDEVEILKLVGASPWYIRFPFIIEGALYGLSGSTLAFITLISLLLIYRQQILTFLSVIPEIYLVLSNPGSTMFFIFAAVFYGILAGFGILLGIIGSLASVGRYLRI